MSQRSHPIYPSWCHKIFLWVGSGTWFPLAISATSLRCNLFFPCYCPNRSKVASISGLTGDQTSSAKPPFPLWTSVCLQGIEVGKGRRCLTEGGKKYLVKEFPTVTAWQQWCFFLILFFSSSISSENVSQIDVKLLCHGITFRQAQICPDLPSLSELAHYTVACDVCRRGSFGFNFEVSLLRFVPLALSFHERLWKGSSSPDSVSIWSEVEEERL